MMLVLSLGVYMTLSACSDDDKEIAGNANELIIGTWQSTRLTGYESFNGIKEEYDDVYTSDQFTFLENGIGTYADLYINSSSSNYTFKWTISGNKLILDEGTSEEEIYTICQLSSNELAIENSGYSGGVEWYEKETFKRIN